MTPRKDREPHPLLAAAAAQHLVRREGDEQACSCGKRWPVGEAHP